MSKSDQWVSVIVVAILLLHLAVWAAGYGTHQLSLFTATLNLLAGATILIYWTVKQLMVKQHYIEWREIIVLGFEIVVMACALCEIIGSQQCNLLKVFQYVFFGVHLIVLITALIFLLTFKINKLM